MKITCLVDNCRNPVNSVCFCNGTPSYICSGHMYLHSGNSHILKNPNKLITKLEKTSLINQFNNFKKREIHYKTALLKVLQNLIKNFEQIISEVNKRINLMNSHISHIKNYDFLLIRLESSCLDNQVLTEKDVQIYLNSIKTTYDIQSIFRESISNLEEHSHHFEMNDALYYIKKESRDLIKIDLSSYSTKVMPLKLNSSKVNYPIVVRIDELKIFIHGGLDIQNRYSSLTYSFDLNSLDLKRLNSNPGRSNAMGLKVSDRIYIFGGLYMGNPMKKSVYFDIDSSTWTTINDLPSYSYNTSQLFLNDKILISGFPENFLYSFIIDGSFYFNLEAGLDFDEGNVLFEFEGRIFLISQKFYVNRSINFERWEWVGRAQVHIGSIATNPVIRGEFAYFVDNNGCVYQFNCRDYGIGVVRCEDSEIRKSLYQTIEK